MGTEFNSDAAFWLSEAYRQCTKEERERPMRFLDIMILYEEHCKQQQTCPHHKEYIVRLIKKIFPDSQSCFVHMNSKRYPAYTNICEVESTTNDSIHITDEVVSVSSDTNNNLSISVPTLHIVSGKSIDIKLTFNEITLDIVVNGTKIENRWLDIPAKVECSQSAIDSLIHLMKTVVICKGTLLQSADDKKSKKNSIIEEWNSVCGNETELRSRSPKCKLLVAWNARNDICSTCSKHFVEKKTAVAKVINCVEDCEDNDVNDCKVNAAQSTCTTGVQITDPMEAETSSDNRVDIENIRVSEEDHQKNFTKMLEDVLPHGVPDEFKELLLSQLKNLDCDKDPRYRRWDKHIIKICLSLYCRSPQAYNDLRTSGMLVLPSPRLMRYYKNAVQQRPGINDTHLQWMHSEAVSTELTAFGMRGGLLLDEMSIQDDLQILKEGDGWKVMGMVDMGGVCNNIDTIVNNRKTVKMATHVLQLVFHGLTGFRWPVAYFATSTATAHQLYINVWDCIDKLDDYGFTTDYIMMDGGSANRAFTNMMFDNDAREKCYTMPDIYNMSHNISIIQDVKHCLKKIRNGVLASRYDNMNASGKHLVCGGYAIVWDHFQEAANYNSHFGMRIHRKLTQEHIDLTPVSKMRNGLATSVLNRDMLFLMRSYQHSLNEPDRLNGTIALLEQTSVLVEIFDDMNRPIKGGDDRLVTLKSVLHYFNKWESEVMAKNTLSETKHLLSKECRDDLNSCILGFLSLCDTVLVKGEAIVPGHINSDLIENFFCQQRGIHHGCNTNPTVNQYGPAVNAICLSQTTVSSKSNSGACGSFFKAV